MQAGCRSYYTYLECPRATLVSRSQPFGSEDGWIGGVLRVDNLGVTASIKPSLIEDGDVLLVLNLGSNVISCKLLNSFVG